MRAATFCFGEEESVLSVLQESLMAASSSFPFRCLSFQMAICYSNANAACFSFVLCCYELDILSARS